MFKTIPVQVKFSVYLFLLIVALVALSVPTSAQAPTVPAATNQPSNGSLKIAGNPTYVQLSYSQAGGLLHEPITALVNVIAVRSSSGGLTLVGTQNCPACSALPMGAGWVTLTKSATPATDSWAGFETWCGGSGVLATSIGAWMISTVTETQTAVGGLTPMVWTFNETGIVNNPATGNNPGFTITTAPAWEKNRAECGGTPALMLTPPATAYNGPTVTPPIPTYVRNSVQAVIVQ